MLGCSVLKSCTKMKIYIPFQNSSQQVFSVPCLGSPINNRFQLHLENTSSKVHEWEQLCGFTTANYWPDDSL